MNYIYIAWTAHWNSSLSLDHGRNFQTCLFMGHSTTLLMKGLRFDLGECFVHQYFVLPALLEDPLEKSWVRAGPFLLDNFHQNIISLRNTSRHGVSLAACERLGCCRPCGPGTGSVIRTAPAVSWLAQCTVCSILAVSALTWPPLGGAEW